MSDTSTASRQEAAQHTPGPWAVCELDPLLIQELPKAHAVADVNFQITTGHSFAECAANARLIAAAPDLLAACRALDDNAPLDSEWGHCGCCLKTSGHHPDCAVILARAAIAKAVRS